MKLKKAIVVNGQVVPAGTDIASEALDASRIPEAALEATPTSLGIDDVAAATILALLKDAYAEEINAWYQYYIIIPFLRGKERSSIITDYQENAKEELEHADLLLERINQLGGNFDGIESLDKLDSLATHKYIKPAGVDVATSLSEFVKAEQGAIETYVRLEATTRGVDVVTNQLAKRILADEQTHLQEMLDFIADIS